MDKDGQKDILWVDSSLEDLKKVPQKAKSEAGHQLNRVQSGLDPEEWKPFASVGAGVKEIRISEDNGIFRVMYVAKFEEGIYVLHCFKKKTRQTSKQDVDLAKQRYKDVVRERAK